VSEPKNKKRVEYAIHSLTKKGRKALPKDIATIVKGAILKKQFLDNLPALKLLQDTMAEKVKAQGYITGLDGRQLPIRSAHTAISSLLQGAEAVVMKKALVLRHKYLLASGAIQKREVCQVVFVHDETQDLVREGMDKESGQLTIKCIEEAGQYFKLRCPLAGESRSGNNWQDTH
jgi:DNA polymerase I-like protein with 3'-5' exonuclease and polymerase domains